MLVVGVEAGGVSVPRLYGAIIGILAEASEFSPPHLLPRQPLGFRGRGVLAALEATLGQTVCVCLEGDGEFTEQQSHSRTVWRLASGTWM